MTPNRWKPPAWAYAVVFVSPLFGCATPQMGQPAPIMPHATRQLSD